MKIFKDRKAAGKLLAKRLKHLSHDRSIIVLAIPRGGVVVAAEVAKKLHLPLDIIVTRKIGAPNQQELALGAVDPDSSVIWDEQLMNELGLKIEDLKEEVAEELREIKRREKVYRQGRKPLNVKGKTVILIDDGIATGATVLAAINYIKKHQHLASRRSSGKVMYQTVHGEAKTDVILAVPVASKEALEKIKSEISKIIVLEIPEFFQAVGQFYYQFEPVTDQEVVQLLNQPSSLRVRIKIPTVAALPRNDKGNKMNDDFLKVAKQAAEKAGTVIQNYSSKFGKRMVKGGDKSNFVTIADTEAEECIVKILTDSFPDHNVVAEEGGGRNGNSEFTWFVDPLDGTFTFTRNIPYFTVSIGLVKNGQPILGVINHIAFKNLYWAIKGGGAFINGRRIQVSKKKAIEETAGVLDHGHRQLRQDKFDLYINKLITKIGYPYGFGSAAISLGLVADGTLDLYVAQAYSWDFVAGTIIIREAGGKVTDFVGNEPDWSKERLNIVASNGLVHNQIIEVLSSSLRGTK